ncbi:MAG: hypothetical protein K6G27_11355 [Lachnospiraceae bacterium]|nr:hypothetical protein [Lachnospiraceae bacterium]
MFSKKLDMLMREMGANNAKVAACAGFDRTNVSRFRNGVRLPEPTSRSIQKLIDGLYIYACDYDRIGRLCDITGASRDGEINDIKLALLKWLYEDEHSGRKPIRLKGRPSASKQKQSGNSFGTRLTDAMSLADISNISLSRMLSVDASLISRYRTGLCMPRPDSGSVDRIGNILFKRIRKNERMRELAGLMKCSEDSITETGFIDWLFDFDTQAPAEEIAVARLLEIFEAFDPDKVQVYGDEPDLRTEILNDESTYYMGIEGLRIAVIRFLTMAEGSECRELMLYSDQDMGWMTEDENYRNSWAYMMARCIKKGIRIKIIHNIDRDLDEMNMAIRSWLPLYMSGMIEPYYNDMPRDGRFFHTLFICPGVAAVEALGATGAEDSSIYHYYTDDDSIGACIATYDRLMDNAEPLVRTGSPDIRPLLNGDVSVIRNTLSIGTMPKELVDEYSDERLKEIWSDRNSALLEILKDHKLYEYAALADTDELDAGKAFTEKYARGLCKNYTRAQYERHLDNIIRLTDEYKGYYFGILPDVMLKDMTIIIGEGFVEIIYDKLPDFAIGFTHPLMIRAFGAFADRLRRMCRIRP